MMHAFELIIPLKVSINYVEEPFNMSMLKK